MSLRDNWEVIIWGTLKFPAGGVEAWQALPVDGAAWSDWQDRFKQADDRTPRTVAHHLREWAAFGTHNEFLSVEQRNTRAGSTIHVQARLLANTFVEKAQVVAALFRAGENTGATGEIVFSGEGVPLEYTLVLTKEGSRLSPSANSQLQARARLNVIRSSNKLAEKRLIAMHQLGYQMPSSWHVAIWGRIDLAHQEQLEIWLGSDIQPAGVYWKRFDPWGWFDMASFPRITARAEFLAELRRIRKDRQFISVQAKEASIEVLGYLHRSEFLPRSILLFEMLRETAFDGASGNVVLASVEAPVGYSIAIQGARAEIIPFQGALNGTEPMQRILADVERRGNK